MQTSNSSPSTERVSAANLVSRPESRRAVRFGVTVGVIVVIASFGAGFVLGRGVQSAASSQGAAKSLEQWWRENHGDVAALRSSIRNSQRALDRQDVAGLGTSCVRMHDDAVVTLKSDLPAPDRTVTAELTSAIEDAHAASHMCLAAKAGSVNNYAGEFRSQMAESDRQLAAVEDAAGGRPATA
jgi:hypothetical protein